MNVSCGSCQTVFRVDPEKIPAAGIRARCNVCQGVFWVRREEPKPTVTDTITSSAVTSVPQPVTVPVFKSPAPPPPAAQQPAPPATTSRPSVPAARPGPAMTPPATTATSTTRPPDRPTGQAPLPPPSTRPSGAPATGAPQPTARRSERPTAQSPAALPKNPFLSQDPKSRARRLARALVSDIVVYHPAKRRDGLRDGSLKLLFEDEIRKSWEEYVDQIGRELADSTNFFTEALNEILADGQPVFP